MDMLNWICPDCGRECLPATRECPLCASSGATGLAQKDAQGASVAALSAAVSGGKTPGSSGAGSSAAGSSVAVMEPPLRAEPEPQAELERDLKQVRDRVGERIARVQQLYAESAPSLQLRSTRVAEPAWEPRREAVYASVLLGQQRSAVAVLRTAAEEQWDARMAEASVSQLTAVIDIWEAAQIGR